MIYHANMRLPKKPDASHNRRCFTQDIIDKLIKNINETTGYHVVEIKHSETEDIITISINTDIVDGLIFE